MSLEEDCSRLFAILCVSRLSCNDIAEFTLTLLAAGAVSQIDSDMEKVDVTNITDTLRK